MALKKFPTKKRIENSKSEGEELRTVANKLCLSEKDALHFLEKVYAAREIVNMLSSWAQTPEVPEHLTNVYKGLDELLSPICPNCDIRARRFITSDANLYDPELAQYPGGTMRYWTGEWYCPKCEHLVAVGNKWWQYSIQL